MTKFVSSYDNQEFVYDLSSHHNDKIAFQFSGGLESTLLLYLTYRYIAENKVDISIKNYIIDDVRYVYHQECLIDLNNKIANIFNCKPFECIFFEGTKRDIKASTMPMIDAYRDCITLLINGLNSNPKTEVSEKWKNVSCDFESEFDEDGNMLNPFWTQLSPNTNGKIYYEWNGMLQYRPLRNVDKRMVIDTYRQIGIYDSVYTWTRTCDQFEGVTTKDFLKHCIACHACYTRFEAEEYMEKIYDAKNS